MRPNRKSGTFVLLLLAGAVFGAESDTELDALITRFYRPGEQEKAPFQGMGRATYLARIQRAKDFLRELHERIDYDQLDIADQVDYDYFRAQLDNSILMMEVLRRWERDPSMYFPFDAFFEPLLDEGSPWEERFEQMVQGMEESVVRFQWGKENLKDPPLVWTEQAIRHCDGIMRYFRQSVPKLLERSPSASLKERLSAASENYQKRLVDYKHFLETDLKPRSTGTFAIREENYDRMLEDYFLDYTVDELIDWGKRLYDENVALMERVAAQIDPDKTWQELLQENMMDHPAPWELYTTLAREADRAREIVYTKLVNVPEGMTEQYRYVEAGHWATLPRGASGIGPFVFTGDAHVGYYALPSIDFYDSFERKNELMLDWSRAWFIAQQIPHEVYPGHHFQVFMASQNERPARRLVGASPFTDVGASFSEGFAVYSEEVMYDLGYLQNDPRLYLAHLAHRHWRIARVSIDPLVHARGMSYEEAHKFFMDAGLTEGQAHVETTQITRMPVHDVAYYVGKLEVMDLLREYRELAGDDFDYKRFHTELMLLGGTPVKLARKEMLAKFVEKTSRGSRSPLRTRSDHR